MCAWCAKCVIMIMNPDSNSEFGSEWCIFVDGGPVNAEFDNLIVLHQHPVITQGFSLWIRRAHWNLVEIGHELATRHDSCKRTLALVDIELLANYDPDEFHLPILVIATVDKLTRFYQHIPKGIRGILSSNSDYNVFREALLSTQDQVFIDPYLTDTWGELKNSIQLTARQVEIVRLVADGNSSKQIAALLNLSPKTVQNHRAEIMRRLSVVSAAEMISKATQLGWLDD